MEQRRHTLLIVDDEVDVLESLRHLFHRTYRVLTASSGGQAVSLLDEHDVHLILSDQRMPGHVGRRLPEPGPPDPARRHPHALHGLRRHPGRDQRGQRRAHLPLHPQALGCRRARGDHPPGGRAVRAPGRAETADRRAAGRPTPSSCRPTRSWPRPASSRRAFIEVASHEFNTPITLVLGLSELLRLAQPGPRRAGAGRSSTGSPPAARQLARLVTNTLTLMRADDFRRTLQRAPVDLVDLLRGVVDQVQPFVEARSSTSTSRWPTTSAPSRSTPTRSTRGVVNLLTNAIKFTPDGGQIELSAGLAEADEAEIQVAEPGHRPGAAGRSSTCSSRSSPSSTRAGTPRATSASTSEGSGSG